MSKAGLRFFDANPNADSDRSHQLLVTCVSSEEDAHQFAPMMAMSIIEIIVKIDFFS